MKILIPFIIFFLTNLTIFPTTELNEKKISELIKNKKYLSAHRYLKKLDPENNNPDILIRKVDLALKYFSRSIHHKAFAFKDLEKDETLMSTRQGNGNFEALSLIVDEELKRLIKRYPENGKLYKALGDYYYSVDQCYGNNWEIKSKELNLLIKENYIKAEQLRVKDWFTLYQLGYYNLVENKPDKAESYFLKSIRLNKKYPVSYYNLAAIKARMNKAKEARLYAAKAAALYKSPFKKRRG